MEFPVEKQPVYDEPPVVPGVPKNNKPKEVIPVYASPQPVDPTNPPV